MANITDTSPSGNDFDGTASNGEIVFGGTTLGRDSMRAIIFSISVTTDGGLVLSEARARLAETLANANGGGPYLELALVQDAAGFTKACCNCVVPAGWKLFIVTTESGVPVNKTLFVDWSIETLVPRF